MPAGTILARAVDALEHDKQRTRSRSIQLSLKVRNAGDIAQQFGLGRLLRRVIAVKSGVKVPEPEF